MGVEDSRVEGRKVKSRKVIMPEIEAAPDPTPGLRLFLIAFDFKTFDFTTFDIRT
jgi:hypothetical protein